MPGLLTLFQYIIYSPRSRSLSFFKCSFTFTWCFLYSKKGVQWQNEDVMAFSITGRGGVRGEGACPSLPQNPPPSLPSLCLGKSAGTHLGPWRQTFSKEKAAAVRVRSDLISKRDEHLQH